MKTIKGDLILTKDTEFNESIEVIGDIKGDYDLKVKGNIDCNNINCYNIDCYNIDCFDINCSNINCYNIDCYNIDCYNINCINIYCNDLSFWAFAIAYCSFKCKSWKGRRDNCIIKCLDGEIEIKEDKVCKECGREL